MVDQPLEWAFAIILAVLLLQSLLLLYWTFQLRRRFSALGRNLDSMASKLSQGLQKVRGIADGLAQRSSGLPEWETRLRKASVKVMESVRNGDQALARLIERLQEHTLLISRKLDQGIQSFTHYSFQVHRSIIQPTGKISDALQAIAALSSSLFSRRSSLPPEFVAEEEEFI